MQTRRNFLKSFSFNLASLISPAIAYGSPLKRDLQKLKFSLEDISSQTIKLAEDYGGWQKQRRQTIPSYDEWKSIQEKPTSFKNLKEYINADIIFRKKVKEILKNPKSAYNLLTKDERIIYHSELNMLEPGDFVIERNLLNKKYNFKFTREDMNKGAFILIFLERYYGYKSTEEKSR